MCADLGYSYHYISGIFKKNFGMNFSAYINQIRLDEAVKLLKYTNKPLVKLQMNADFQQLEILTLPLKIILESLRENIERNITLNEITG